MDDKITVQHLGKRFRRYHVDAPGTAHEVFMRGFRKLMPAEKFWGLRDVSFRVGAGRTLGIVGRNGAGKSTLLRLIGGVGRPDEGFIEVAGRVGALLSLGCGFHPELTGRENLVVNGVIGGMTRREVKKQFDSIVSFAELEQFVDSPMRTYSSGMQMRLAFSIAIHSTPEILLIDEVLAVGDYAFQAKCMDRIMALKDRGSTIVLVSHDLNTIQDLCDEALWLRGGKVGAYGPCRAVVAKYLAEAETPTWSHLAAPSK